MHFNIINLSTGDLKKPKIITFYNLTKGAVDVDEMTTTYTIARKSNHWHMVTFFFYAECCCNKYANFFVML